MTDSDYVLHFQLRANGEEVKSNVQRTTVEFGWKHFESMKNPEIVEIQS